MGYIKENKELRKCSQCGKVLPTSYFHKRSGTLYHSECKECKNLRYKEYHLRTWSDRKDKHYCSSRFSYAKKLQKFTEFLSEQACVDCGCNDPLYLEFDHKDQTSKEFTISEKKKRLSINNLMKEIGKCDIVCVNCHKIRTYNTFFFIKKETIDGESLLKV